MDCFQILVGSALWAIACDGVSWVYIESRRPMQLHLDINTKCGCMASALRLGHLIFGCYLDSFVSLLDCKLEDLHSWQPKRSLCSRLPLKGLQDTGLSAKSVWCTVFIISHAYISSYNYASNTRSTSFFICYRYWM